MLPSLQRTTQATRPTNNKTQNPQPSQVHSTIVVQPESTPVPLYITGNTPSMRYSNVSTTTNQSPTQTSRYPHLSRPVSPLPNSNGGILSGGSYQGSEEAQEILSESLKALHQIKSLIRPKQSEYL